MYIAGTSSFRDVTDDALLPIGEVQKTQRYVMAVNQFEHAEEPVLRVVGHSLGGAVALALANRYNLAYDVYANPGVSWRRDPHRHRARFDPISILDRGASSSSSRTWNPHAVRATPTARTPESSRVKRGLVDPLAQAKKKRSRIAKLSRSKRPAAAPADGDT